MLTSAPADCSVISVVTLVCLSIYWLTCERFYQTKKKERDPTIFQPVTDGHLMRVLSAGNIAKSLSISCLLLLPIKQRLCSIFDQYV